MHSILESMPPTDLPETAPGFEQSRLMGSWYVLASNSGLWRQRTHPHIEYSPLPPDADGRPRFLDSLRFRQNDLLGRAQRRMIVGIDVAEREGQFVWRGKGALWVCKSRWCVPLVDSNYRWVVTYIARSNLGVASGVDICTRDPTVSQSTFDQILAAIGAHPFLSAPEKPGRPRRCDDLVATVQDWAPPIPYRLDV
jgi:hypothetical protein